MSNIMFPFDYYSFLEKTRSKHPMANAAYDSDLIEYIYIDDYLKYDISRKPTFIQRLMNKLMGNDLVIEFLQKKQNDTLGA